MSAPRSGAGSAGSPGPVAYASPTDVSGGSIAVREHAPAMTTAPEIIPRHRPAGRDLGPSLAAGTAELAVGGERRASARPRSACPAAPGTQAS
jgi:hypothetical protein